MWLDLIFAILALLPMLLARPVRAEKLRPIPE